MERLFRNKAISGWLMASPLTLVLVFFLVLPVVMIVVVSFWRATEFSIIPDFDFENYEFLFGSPDRMIRLDMSEFQTPDTLTKIVGGGDEPGTGDDRRGGALVDRIRKQPFAVVLLDEFEKAHPRVWDLFLQVFDDGRLSDHQGNAADFRNAIIILTSNLGAVIPSGTGVGFSEESGRFHATAVVREVERSFRKEFLNRLDRVVVFRPFSRETMRAILGKELTEAFRRRGLRNRAWSVEWDQSAIEFLLERGFTADLGARPLKRAVERYVPVSYTHLRAHETRYTISFSVFCL